MLPQNCGIVAVELRRPKVYKIINTFSTRFSTLRAGRWFFNLHQLIYIACITWARVYWKFIRLAHRGGNFVTQIWPFQNWRRKWSEYLDRALASDFWSGPHKDNDDNVKLGISQHSFCAMRGGSSPVSHLSTDGDMLSCCWLSDITFLDQPLLCSLILFGWFDSIQSSQQPAILRTLEAEVERLI